MVFGERGAGAGGGGQRADGQPPVGVGGMAEQQAQDLSTGITAGTGHRHRSHAAILHGYAVAANESDGPSVRLCGCRYRERCRFWMQTVRHRVQTSTVEGDRSVCYGPARRPSYSLRRGAGPSSAVWRSSAAASSAPPLPGRSCSDSPMPMSRSSKKRTASLRTRPVATAGSSTPASTTDLVRPKPCCAAGVSASSRRSAKNAGSAESPAGRSLSRSTTWSVGGWTTSKPGRWRTGYRASGSSVPTDLRELEAHVVVSHALHSPIHLDVDFTEVTQALVADAVAAGAKIAPRARGGRYPARRLRRRGRCAHRRRYRAGCVRPGHCVWRAAERPAGRDGRRRPATR